MRVEFGRGLGKRTCSWQRNSQPNSEPGLDWCEGVTSREARGPQVIVVANVFSSLGSIYSFFELSGEPITYLTPPTLKVKNDGSRMFAHISLLGDYTALSSGG